MNDIFPWYDSGWLSSYVRVKQLIQQDYPHKYAEFTETLKCLKTRLDFKNIEIDRIFDNATFSQIEKSIAAIVPTELERHEFLQFGRYVVHDRADFTRLHHRITPLVSELVGELVEPSYNFLSLYNNLGICRVHMDAPYAKYTLDVCIDRSHDWPIYFSQVKEWPEELQLGVNWEREIIADPANIFTACDLQPRQAVIFSGSSQWHYRQRIPQQVDNNFCHLLFFHFIPHGMASTIDPHNWATLFDIPKLSEIIVESQGTIEHTRLSSAVLNPL